MSFVRSPNSYWSFDDSSATLSLALLSSHRDRSPNLYSDSPVISLTLALAERSSHRLRSPNLYSDSPVSSLTFALAERSSQRLRSPNSYLRAPSTSAPYRVNVGRRGARVFSSDGVDRAGRAPADAARRVAELVVRIVRGALHGGLEALLQRGEGVRRRRRRRVLAPCERCRRRRGVALVFLRRGRRCRAALASDVFGSRRYLKARNSTYRARQCA